MTTLTENNRDAGFLVSEGPGQFSRDDVTIAINQTLEAGAVLGQVSASGEFVEFDPAGRGGAEIAAAVLLYATTTDATNTARAAVISRLAEVSGSLLVWKTGITQAQIDAAVAQLAGNDIIAR
jgi:hypothetical protein